MAPSEQPILFLWSFSPWSNKVVSYLNLRKIPYARCEQPICQPRPDIAALGVNYRRVPILSIGRNIYCDSLIILETLDTIYPRSKEHPAISSRNGTNYGMERLLEKWTDVVVFKPAAAVIPTDLDLMKDPQFQKDREELWGREWSKEAQDELRPPAEVNLRENFDFLEQVLEDGRKWILGGDEGPMLADIHGCWIFDWLFQLPGAFPEEFFNAKRYPKTFAWRERYFEAIAKAEEESLATELEGKDAVEKILSSEFHRTELKVEADPLGLKEGQQVEMYPIDTGYSRKDSGKLVGLSSNEAVVETKSQQGEKDIRIHYPRWNFTLAPAGQNGMMNGK